jgi:hypothetical protein
LSVDVRFPVCDVMRVSAFPWLNSLHVDLFFGDFWLLTIEGRASRAEPVTIVLY